MRKSDKVQAIGSCPMGMPIYGHVEKSDKVLSSSEGRGLQHLAWPPGGAGPWGQAQGRGALGLEVVKVVKKWKK